MRLTPWLSLLSKSLLRGKSARLQTQRQRRVVIDRLESLEDRMLLSTFYVDNTPTIVAGANNDQFTPTGGSLATVTNLDLGVDLFTSIGAAISAAAANGVGGDIILVADGTYSEGNNINEALTILGNQSGVPATAGRPALNETIIDNAGGAFGVYADNVTIDGLVIQNQTNSNAAPGFGYALYLAPGHTGATIQNNVIQNNIIGLALSNTGGTQTVIRNNLFRDNTNPGPAGGHDIYADQYTSGIGGVDNVLIDGNTFTSTSFDEDAWAIGISNTAATPFTDLVITNNTISNHGRGMYFYSTDGATITGNVITDVTHYGIGIFDSGVAGTENSDFTIDSNTITPTPPGEGVSIDSTGYEGPLIVTNSGPVNVYGTAGNDDVTLKMVGGVLQYTLGVDTYDLTGASEFNFFAGAGNDTLTIDYNGSNFTLPITFDGGADSDALSTLGGSFTSGQVTSTGVGAGSIQYDLNGLITFTGLEPITDDNVVANYTIDATAAVDNITIADSAGSRTLVSEGGNNFESVAFKNKANVTINGLGSDDTFTLNNPTPAAGLNSLTVDGGSGADTLSVDALFSLAGTIDLSVDTVNLNDNLTATTSLTGTATTINVNNNTAQIQDGVDISGPLATVNIAAGTYTETVNATAGKSVTLALAAGAAGQVTLNGNLVLNADDALQIQLTGLNAATQFDNFVVSGGVTLNGATLVPTLSFTPQPLDRFTIIDNDAADAVTGVFGGLTEGSIITLGAIRLRVSYIENHAGFGDGNDVSLTVMTPPVSVSFSNGSLTINGTGLVDDFIIDVTGTNSVTLTGNDVTNFTGVGTAGQFAGPYIVTGGIFVNTGNSNDKVLLRGLGGAAKLDGGNVSIDLGAGDDILTTIDTAVVPTLTTGLTLSSGLSVIGGTGNDVVTLGSAAVNDTFKAYSINIDNGTGVNQTVNLDRNTVGTTLTIKNSGTGLQTVALGANAANSVGGNLTITQADGASGYTVGVRDTNVGGLVSITNGNGSGTATVTMNTSVARTVTGTTTITNGNNATNAINLVGTVGSLQLTGNITARNGNATVSNGITVTDLSNSGGSASSFTNGLAPVNAITFNGALNNTFVSTVAATNGVSTGTNAITATRLSSTKGLTFINGNATTSDAITLGGTAGTSKVAVTGNVVLTNGNAAALTVDIDGLTTSGPAGSGTVTLRNGTSAAGGTTVKMGANAGPGTSTLAGNLSIVNLASTGARLVNIDRTTVNGTTGASINESDAGNSTLNVGTIAPVMITAKLDMQDGSGDSTVSLNTLTVASITYNDLSGGVDTINLANAGGSLIVSGITRLTTGNGSDIVNIATTGSAFFGDTLTISLGAGDDSLKIGANVGGIAFSAANKFSFDGSSGTDTIMVSPFVINGYTPGSVPAKLKPIIAGFENIL